MRFAIASGDGNHAKSAKIVFRSTRVSKMPSSQPASSASRSPNHRQQASVAMAFVDGMLIGARRQGIDCSALLASCGISLADAASRVPVEHYARLYNRLIARLEDEAFGLFHRPMPPDSFEFLCRGMLGAPTLGEALGRASRFLRLVVPAMQMELQRGERHAAILIDADPQAFACPGPDARVFAFEWLLRLLHSVACWFVNRSVALDSVLFPYPRPAHAPDYNLVYAERSEFNGQQLIARLHDNLLDLPIRRDDAALSRFLDGGPGRISMLYRRDREMVLRVRDLLRAALPDNLGIEAVARELHLSTRTLHRRLEDEGSSFRRIKDATRRDIAYARLTKTRQSIAQLAADLGYADTSTFYRAFVSWSGQSPEQFRAQLASRQN